MILAGLMLGLVLLLFGLRAALHSRADLVIENLALRQQLAVLAHPGRPWQRDWADRLFWVTLRRLWARWSDVLVFAKPETVIQWHEPASAGTGPGSRGVAGSLAVVTTSSPAHHGVAGRTGSRIRSTGRPSTSFSGR